MKTLKILIIILILSCTSCGTSSYLAKNKLIGEYEYFESTNIGESKIKLILDESGLYSYFLLYSTVKDGLCNVSNCTSKGTWKIEGSNLILNSFLQSNKPEDYIEQIKLYDYHHDSIMIELLNLSDSSPVKDEIITLYDKKNSMLPINFKHPIKTNEKGIAIFSEQSVKNIEYPISKCLPGMPRIPLPKKGYYYRIMYQDCNPTIFNDAKFEIKGDTLIKHEKIVTNFTRSGRKIYTKFSFKYVKIR